MRGMSLQSDELRHRDGKACSPLRAAVQGTGWHGIARPTLPESERMPRSFRYLTMVGLAVPCQPCFVMPRRTTARRGLHAPLVLS